MSFTPNELKNYINSFISDPNLDQELIYDVISDLILSETPTDFLQEPLIDLLGYDSFDLISILLSQRDEWKAGLTNALTSIDDSPSILAELNKLTSSSRGKSAKTALLESKMKDFEASLLPQSFLTENSVINPKTLDTSALPSNAVKSEGEYTFSLNIPATETPNRDHLRLKIKENLPKWAWPAFGAFTSLNPVQSTVFQDVFHGESNILVSAATSAGKTLIALLAILKTIERYGLPLSNEVKMLYIAPMKALATEQTATFNRHLGPLGVKVKEWTGDTQLSTAELMKTHLLVMTPEKWDIVTRKMSDDHPANYLKLMILDEVHLLDSSRGSVVEAIVMRAFKNAEALQMPIRLLALSATMPNYDDIANFLRAPVIHHFDASWRPVPLDVTFIGLKKDCTAAKIAGSREQVTEDSSSEIPEWRQQLDYEYAKQMASYTSKSLEHCLTVIQSKREPKTKQQRADQVLAEAQNAVCYQKLREEIENGRQVLVFVNTRDSTHQSAVDMITRFTFDGANTLLTSQAVKNTKEADKARKALANSKVSYVKTLSAAGFGVHHAGLSKQDRSAVVDGFSSGYLRVIFCTSTLAWGVNLPAATVIVKGTKIYTSEEGWVPMSILDVQQIFGRAGRPQFKEQGKALIIGGSNDVLQIAQRYFSKKPIESQLLDDENIVSLLNAEISLGTLSTIEDAVAYFMTSFLYVRLLKAPLFYKLSVNEDPTGYMWLRRKITQAAERLAELQLIDYDEYNETFSINQLSTVASHFYMHPESTHTIMTTVKEGVYSYEAALHLLATLSEFKQLIVRRNEEGELAKMAKRIRYPVSMTMDDNVQKVYILLQCIVEQLQFRDSPSLRTDMLTIQDSLERLIGAIYEIAVVARSYTAASIFFDLSIAVKNRCWHDVHPLSNCVGIDGFNQHMLDSFLDRTKDISITLDDLLELTASEINSIIRLKTGAQLKRASSHIPNIEFVCRLLPITAEVAQIEYTATPTFKWCKAHGQKQKFVFFFESGSTKKIIGLEEIKFPYGSYLPVSGRVTLLIGKEHPPFIRIVARPAEWYGTVSYNYNITLGNIRFPDAIPAYTPFIKDKLVPISQLEMPLCEAYYPFTHFNSLQSACFYTLFETNMNTLIGAPTGSGKTICAEIAFWRLTKHSPSKKLLYVAPLKALVDERYSEWSNSLEPFGFRVKKFTGDHTLSASELSESDIIITTPEKMDASSRQWKSKKFLREIGLVIIDEVHLLGMDRGPVLESVVSRLRFLSKQFDEHIRVVALTTAVANPQDLANWLDVPDCAIYNFSPENRPVKLVTHVKGFPGRSYAARNRALNRPCYSTIVAETCRGGEQLPTLLFASSRRQVRRTAEAVMTYAAHDNRVFSNVDQAELFEISEQASNPSLQRTLRFGIGMHHAGLSISDRELCEALFKSGKIKVLVCSATLAWGVNLPAYLVIAKDCMYYDGYTNTWKDFSLTEVLQITGRAGRPQFSSTGVAYVFCREDKREFYDRFLTEPFPVESHLTKCLTDYINAEVSSERILVLSEVLDWVRTTFWYIRLKKNPSYYGLGLNPSDEDIDYYIISYLSNVIKELMISGCLTLSDQVIELNPSVADILRMHVSLTDYWSHAILPTPLGSIISKYYMSNNSAKLFVDYIKEDSKFEDLLAILCASTEMDQLPVRHYEDALNEELASRLKLTIPALSEGYNSLSPHYKAHVLLQAHFSGSLRATEMLECGVTPEIALTSDYELDTATLVGNAKRVAQAMMDYAVFRSWPSTTMECHKLVQSISSGLWPNDKAIKQLPRCWTLHGLSLRQLIKFSKSKKHDFATFNPELFNIVSSIPLIHLHVESYTNRKLKISYKIHRLTHRDKAYSPFDFADAPESFVLTVYNKTEILHHQKLGGSSFSCEVTIPFGDDDVVIYAAPDNLMGLDEVKSIKIVDVLEDSRLK